MEENKEGTQQAAQEAYVRQLAELSARVLHMTEEQKQRNAAKIEELNKRVAALPPALRGLYAQKLRSLAPEAPAPQACPKAPAAPLFYKTCGAAATTTLRREASVQLKNPSSPIGTKPFEPGPPRAPLPLAFLFQKE